MDEIDALAVDKLFTVIPEPVNPCIALITPNATILDVDEILCAVILLKNVALLFT